MKQHYGILLIEKNETVLRVYEVSDKEWKLLYYRSLPVQKKLDRTGITFMEAIVTLLSSEHAEHVSEWKVCSRHLPPKTVMEISSATGLTIENLNLMREQELLCKGMFTELW